jgi:DNA replication and repair protein RecF
MHIEQLGLFGFRNFRRVADVSFSPQGLLVAAAPNATGKTNFLESIVMLLRGKSWRGTHEECTQWDQSGFIIEGVMQRGYEARSDLRVSYHLSSKKLRVEEDGVPASVVTFYSHYPFVLFLPEDTFLLTRGPAQRRTFLNHVLVVVPQYLSALVQYQRALRHRNALLKRARTFQEVRVWTDILVEHALVLWRYRESFTAFLQSQLRETYERVSGEHSPLTVTLRPGISGPLESFRQALDASFSREQKFGYTLSGPHLDDLIITTGDRPAQAVLSRGQVRGVVIALKLLARGYMENVTGERPLLLLDDVLSELDQQRQRIFLESLPTAQLLLTCTALPSSLKGRSDVQWLDLRPLITARARSSRGDTSHKDTALLNVADTVVDKEKEEARVERHAERV